jgi:hypothetical protein
MQEWMNPFRKQNPLVLCQILEDQMLFVSSAVVVWKYSVERSRSKGHSRDLGIRGWRRHQGEVHFTDKDAMTDSMANWVFNRIPSLGYKGSRIASIAETQS